MPKAYCKIAADTQHYSGIHIALLAGGLVLMQPTLLVLLGIIGHRAIVGTSVVPKTGLFVAASLLGGWGGAVGGGGYKRTLLKSTDMACGRTGVGWSFPRPRFLLWLFGGGNPKPHKRLNANPCVACLVSQGSSCRCKCSRPGERVVGRSLHMARCYLNSGFGISPYNPKP